MGKSNLMGRRTGTLSFWVVVSATLLWGCGGTEVEPSSQTEETVDTTDTGNGSEEDSQSGTDEEGSSTGTGDETNSDTGSDAGSENETGTDTGDGTDGEGDGSETTDGACSDTMVITFDLAGSRFKVDPKSGLAETAEEEIGPGTVTVRFDVEDGEPVAGRVTILEYRNAVDFSISDVDTDMDTFAGPDNCGVAVGELSSEQVSWSSQLRDYTSDGTVTCNASSFICGIIGMEQGVPEEQHSVQDLGLDAFEFDAAFESFEMNWVEVTDDSDATTFLKLSGTRSTKPDEQPVCEPAPACP